MCLCLEKIPSLLHDTLSNATIKAGSKACKISLIQCLQFSRKKKDNYNLQESASSHAFLRMSVVNWGLCESRYQVWDQSSRSILGSTLRIHASKTQEEKADLEGAEAESQCSSNKGLEQACGCPVPHGDQSLMQTAPGREQNCGEGTWLRAIPERTESHSSVLMEGLQWHSTVSILQRYRQD